MSTSRTTNAAYAQLVLEELARPSYTPPTPDGLAALEKKAQHLFGERPIRLLEAAGGVVLLFVLSEDGTSEAYADARRCAANLTRALPFNFHLRAFLLAPALAPALDGLAALADARLDPLGRDALLVWAHQYGVPLE